MNNLRFAPGSPNFFGSGFEIPFCLWASLLPGPPLWPRRPWGSGGIVGRFFCSWNQLLEVPEMVPVLLRRCQRWPWPSTLASGRWNLCLGSLGCCSGGTFGPRSLSSTRCVDSVFDLCWLSDGYSLASCGVVVGCCPKRKANCFVYAELIMSERSAFACL